MGQIAEKEQLIENVARLRRAERAYPSRNSDEIVAVRMDLERAVGRTATRAMAARLLGVSQTALDRWIDCGDIPVVVTPTGRREVPLHALVELIDLVETRKLVADDPRPLASVLRERRSRAAQLDLQTILPRRYRRKDRHGHRDAELRSLVYHRAVAQRLDRRTVLEAQQRLQQWRQEGKIDPHYAERWAEILSWPVPRIARLIGQDSAKARDLRQSSPFAGVLSEPERQRVLEAVG